ncbi:MAG: response regulator [Bacteriovoracaceae bacterium]
MNNLETGLAKTLRILIVEDSEAGTVFLRQELKTLGFEDILTAGNGVEGIKRVEESEENSKPVELIIADINMPKMDGIEMVKQLKVKPERKGIPILIVSAERDKTKVLEAINAGVSQYILKPYSRKDIISKIQSVFQ